MTLELPDFPWDALAPYGERARAHPAGILDLSVGSPVDATPAVVVEALAAAGDAHGYPATAGTPALREAIVDWFARRRGVTDLTVANVIPTIGSKEFIALLPTMLGLGAGDVVVQPRAAYPTYAVGAAVVGAAVVSSDEPDEWPETTRLVWLNSPGNPDGRVLDVEFLRRAVVRARELGATIVNDECYAELDWRDGSRGATPSILDPAVTQGSRELTLAVYSLSKQSNMAGYRGGLVAGCSDLVGRLLGVRKHLGLNPPAPIQAAMTAALRDDAHVDAQREVYRRRRQVLRTAVEGAGFRIDGSDAGLYLWATRGEDSWATVQAFADHGILVTPGVFYGDAGREHVRIALTASDAHVREAAERLTAWGLASSGASALE